MMSPPRLKESLWLISFFLFAKIFALDAQLTPLWSRNLGGSGEEATGLTLINLFAAPGLAFDVGADGVFLGVSSLSTDGMVGYNAGGEDVWLVKMNHAGDTLWTRLLAGSDTERPSAVLALSDGGCVVVGRTLSNDGFFTGNHGNYDGFACRFDAAGQLLWKKMYGGSSSDFLFDGLVASDGTLMMCGETGSSDGDLFGTGAGLSWLVKANLSNGNVIWSETYVGPNGLLPDALENFYRITELSDGSGFVAAGYTVANFNDINGDDIYYHKISPSGQSVWAKKLGSTNGGEGLGKVLDAGNGAFYLAGRLAGNAGPDVTAPYRGGNGDVWLIKCDANGNKVWDRSYGGSDWEFAYDLTRDSLSYLYLAAFTRSEDQDAAGASAGLQDFWILKTDAGGDLLWTYRTGGSQNDVLHAIKIFHHDLYVAGRTNSTDGVITQSWGGRDAWVARYGQTDGVGLALSEIHQRFGLFPNPATNWMEITGPEDPAIILVEDIRGVQQAVPVSGRRLNLESLKPGIYFLRLTLKDGRREVLLLVKQ